MKSRTLIEVTQLPGRKPFQQSPASASFLRAALAFMVRLPAVFDWLRWRRRSIQNRRNSCARQPIIVARALRQLIYVKPRGGSTGPPAIARAMPTPQNDASVLHCTSDSAAGPWLSPRHQAGTDEARPSRSIDLDQSPFANGAPDPTGGVATPIKDPERHHECHASRCKRRAQSQQI
jgi:hypothetical protein